MFLFLNSYCHCMHVVSYQLLCLLFSCGVNFYFIILLKTFFMRCVSEYYIYPRNHYIYQMKAFKHYGKLFFFIFYIQKLIFYFKSFFLNLYIIIYKLKKNRRKVYTCKALNYIPV